jgi:hypothetical protein
MSPHKFICSLALFAGATNIAMAQVTLGQLLDNGAKRLSGEELRTVLVGTMTSGPSLTGANMLVDVKPNGKASGYITTPRGPISFLGTWDIADHGKLCVKYQFSGNIPDYEGCAYYFLEGEHYFVLPSDADRNATALPRTFKR